MPTPSASDLLTLDPALVARFRADVIALSAAPTPAAPLALAVSGGPDSMAMLALAHATFPGAIAAATVDHGLRPANADEARIVASWCAGVAVPHRTMAAGDAPAAGENLHVWARETRYRLLADWRHKIGAVALATAHHADDLAETFLMRAARGAGLSGLAGVRARLDEMIVSTLVRESDGTIIIETPLAVVRPLLGWRRAELHVLAEAAGLPFVDDPSNRDRRFDRTRVRAWLAHEDAPDPLQLSRSAARLADIDADLRAFARELWDSRLLQANATAIRLDVSALPRTMRRYLAGMALDLIALLAKTGPVNPNFEAMLDALAVGSAATQGGVMASAQGDVWTFTPAPPRRAPKPTA